jgi:hypothetical protein
MQAGQPLADDESGIERDADEKRAPEARRRMHVHPMAVAMPMLVLMVVIVVVVVVVIAAGRTVVVAMLRHGNP